MNTQLTSPRISMEQHKAYVAQQDQKMAQQHRHLAQVQQRQIENHVADQVAFGKSQQSQHRLNVQA